MWVFACILDFCVYDFYMQIQIFNVGDFVSVRILRIDQSSTDSHRLPCVIVEHLGRSVLAAVEVTNLTAGKFGMFLVWDYTGAHVFGSILSRLSLWSVKRGVVLGLGLFDKHYTY